MLSDAVEESMRLRAALADAHGVFLRTDWEYHTARFMRNVWMIDCNSLNDHLRNPTFTKCSDKRLSIYLAALRQMVWLTPDGELREEIGSDQPDMVRWIDTSCMGGAHWWKPDTRHVQDCIEELGPAGGKASSTRGTKDTVKNLAAAGQCVRSGVEEFPEVDRQDAVPQLG